MFAALLHGSRVARAVYTRCVVFSCVGCLEVGLAKQMVHSCCVVDCTAHWGPDKKFFRIPSEKNYEKRKKWLAGKPGSSPLLTGFVKVILFMVRARFAVAR